MILCVVTEDVPRVSDEQRATVEQISEHFLRVTLRFGFMETPNIAKALPACRKEGWKFDVMRTSFFLSRRSLKPAAHSPMPGWQDWLFLFSPGGPTMQAVISASRLSGQSRLGHKSRCKTADAGQPSLGSGEPDRGIDLICGAVSVARGFSLHRSSAMALNISFNPVKRFTQPAVNYYAEQFSAGGQRRWRGYGKFDLEIDLDSRLPETQVRNFEYRQFIRGVVWYRKWIDDTAGDWVKVDHGVANSNKAFKIPAYAGVPMASGLPATAVAGVGLDDWKWKEDGVIRHGQAVRYGYRGDVKVSVPRERDEWLGGR